MPRKNSRTRPQPLTRKDVDRAIADLRLRRVPARTSREDLGKPLDPRIRVDRDDGWHKLVLVVDDVDVSWSTVVDFEQQIGSSVVRMGGIAGVGTRDDSRFRGYSKCVLKNCLRWMRAEGYHTSMLYGIPSYYPKFGYVRAFPEPVHTVTVRDAENVTGPELTFEPFDASRDLKGVLRIYRDWNAGRTGVTRRDVRTWRPFRKGLSWMSEALVEVSRTARGRVQAYVAFHRENLSAKVIEVGARSARQFPAILRRCADYAWQQRLESIQFHLPEDDAFVEYCRTCGIQTRIRCPADGGPMVRTIDVPGALAAVSDELAPRAPCGRGCLGIKTNLDAARLSWDGGAVTVDATLGDGPVVRMPQWALAQLLYGYRTPSRLAGEGTIKGRRADIDVLDRIFPVRPHYQYAVDHF